MEDRACFTLYNWMEVFLCNYFDGQFYIAHYLSLGIGWHIQVSTLSKCPSQPQTVVVPENACLEDSTSPLVPVYYHCTSKPLSS